jgi:signal transduction histidine kinase
MFVWSLLDFVAVTMFFLAYYFLYTFITGKDLPVWQKVGGFLVLLPSAYVAFLGINIPAYDLNSCIALEDKSATIYTYYYEAFIILVTLGFALIQYRKTKDRTNKSKILLASAGVLTFMLVFFSATFLVSRFASTDASSYVYNYLIYGLFGMPIFLIYLGYLIVRYHAFDLRVFAAQALSASVVALIATQYAFLTDASSFILNTVSLLLAIIISVYLTRNVKREIALREDLEIANKGQESLIHLMNHQIKGYIGKDRSVFAELLTGDYGVIADQARDLIQEGLKQSTKGIEYVQSILRGASAEKGTLPYEMKRADVIPMVNKLLSEQKEIAEKQNLSFESSVSDSTLVLDCDILQLEESFKNLITNAIKYNNPQGKVAVNLSQRNGSLVFSVSDTGIGIPDEDRSRMFTAGGMGKNSIKHNTDASGFGLAFVKGVVEAHKGRVSYRSNYPHRGTTFTVVLPLSK